MKIYIIGPSCVGKTRLGKILSQKLKIANYVDLDLCFNDFESLEGGKLRYYEREIAEKKYQSLVKGKRDWITEGVFPIMDAFEKADRIILIKYSFWLPIYFQWKRFLTDKWQRETYGFLSNLRFTPDILRQYFCKNNAKDLENPLVFSVKKYEAILKKYEDKLIRINSPGEYEMLIKNWKILRKD